MPRKKQSTNNSAIWKFIKYLTRFKTTMIVATAFAVASAILNLIGPNQLSKITNLITAGLHGKIDFQAIMRIVVLLIIIYVASWLFNSAQSYMMSTMSQRVTQQMRSDISQKINRMPLRYFDSHATGDTLSRVTNDVDTLGQSLNQSIAQLISSGALIIFCVIMMFATNWIMALSGVIATFLGFGLSIVIIQRSQKYFNQQQVELGKVDGTVEETFSSLEIVKAFNGQKNIKNTFTKQNNELYHLAWKATFLSALMNPLMQFVGNLAYVVVCIVGAVLTKNGVTSFGVIVAFMIYIRLFTQPLQNLAQAVSGLQQMAAASERVFQFLGEDEMSDESNKTKKLTKIKGNIDFNHVKFGYDPKKVIIHDFSEAVKPGQKIAIVGPTGAGKTTIVNLLMRFYEINSGKIAIDGVSTKDITRDNVHELFGMVLQDTWLFQGTLRENLVYNKQNVSEETLDRVCADVGLTDLVKQLPKGYDTVLDDNADISVGQRQLITIARAMIKDAPLLILDEATSSVDTRTELQVQNAMDKLMKGRTSFVIAHRLSTIKNADKILVLNHGDVIESGNHEQLMAKHGFYEKLYESQFEPTD